LLQISAHLCDVLCWARGKGAKGRGLAELAVPMSNCSPPRQPDGQGCDSRTWGEKRGQKRTSIYFLLFHLHQCKSLQERQRTVDLCPRNSLPRRVLLLEGEAEGVGCSRSPRMSWDSSALIQSEAGAECTLQSGVGSEPMAQGCG